MKSPFSKEELYTNKKASASKGSSRTAYRFWYCKMIV